MKRGVRCRFAWEMSRLHQAELFPISYVLHAITLDIARSIRPNDQTIRTIGRSIFGLCEQLAIAQIAIPAIAVGVAHFSPERSARIILESLAEHAISPTLIQKVVFSVPDDTARHALIEQLNSILADPSRSSETSVFDASAVTMQAPPVDPTMSLEDRSRKTSSDRRVAYGALRKGRGWRALLPAWWWTKETDRLGRLNDRYLILDVVGQGGMGTVYRAWDAVAKRLVVIRTTREPFDRQGVAELDVTETRPWHPESDDEFSNERNRSVDRLFAERKVCPSGGNRTWRNGHRVFVVGYRIEADLRD